MTQREQQILDWIRENPRISQQELAEKAGITRSSVAVHISNLAKKGYILGKGYVLSPDAEPLVRDYIAEESADGSFGNGRGVRNIFEHILVAQNNRLAKMDSVTRDDLMTLTADDVLHARGKLDD